MPICFEIWGEFFEMAFWICLFFFFYLIDIFFFLLWIFYNVVITFQIGISIYADKEIIISPILYIAESSLAQTYGMTDTMWFQVMPGVPQVIK